MEDFCRIAVGIHVRLARAVTTLATAVPFLVFVQGQTAMNALGKLLGLVLMTGSAGLIANVISAFSRIGKTTGHRKCQSKTQNNGMKKFHAQPLFREMGIAKQSLSSARKVG